MKVFITGSTGYIGHELALKLALENFQVNALVRNLNSRNIPKHPNISLFKGDICRLETIEEAIKNCNYVFHTAAYTNLKDDNIDNFYSTNVQGTKNVLKASLKNNIKKLVYTSTLSVYGPSYKNVSITENQPRMNSYQNNYELTKKMSEQLVLDYVNKGLDSTILNISRVYGPGLNTFSNGINQLIRNIKRSNYLVVPRKLNIKANYVFLEDVLNAHIVALKKGEIGGNYIIGGENVDYNKLFRIIENKLNKRILLLKVNYQFMRNLIRVISGCLKIVGKNNFLTASVLDSLFTNRKASSQKARIDLNHRITPLDVGLSKTIKYLTHQKL